MPVESYIDLHRKDKSPEISEREALKKQYEILSRWTPKSDIWSIKWGRAILSCSTVLSSFYIMRHYRRKLKLMSYGHPVTFVPSVVMPALLAPIFHQEVALNPILLQPQCAVCIQVRSALLQAGVGVFHPLVASSAGSFYLAYSFGTYRLPALSFSNIKEFFGVWKKVTKPISSVLSLHMLLQAAISFIVTEMEAKAFFDVQEQLIQKLKSSPS